MPCKRGKSKNAEPLGQRRKEVNMKKIIGILLGITVLLCPVYAEAAQRVGTAQTIQREYQVQVNENADIPETIRENGKTYTLFDTKEETLSEIQKVPVDIKKTFTVDEAGSSKEEDAKKIPESIAYTPEGSDSISLSLDKESLVVTKGAREEIHQDVIVSETQTVTVGTNDIDALAKSVTKDGKILPLTSVSYQVVERDARDIPVTYRASCYYADVETVTKEVVSDYKVTASYTGFYEKQIDSGKKITASYQPEEVKAEKKSFLPAAVATGGVIICFAGCIILFFPNVTVYEITGNSRRVVCRKRARFHGSVCMLRIHADNKKEYELLLSHGLYQRIQRRNASVKINNMLLDTIEDYRFSVTGI